MKCKICGRKDKKYIKVKSGTICPDCCESLPRIIRDNVADITAKQILNACRILKRADSLVKSRPATDVCGNTAWQ